MANPASRDPVPPEQLALQRLYHWEKTAPGQVILTQPQGGGAIRDFTWGEAIGDVRRMAAHLRSLGFPPGSRIAILSKNCAHWLLADFAIWMAGHVSVPLYPTLAAGTIRQILEHSESKLLFVGKLDGWEAMRPGVPPGLPCIGLPLAPANDFPPWDAIVAKTPPLAESPVRDGNELS
ncbi:MAG: AMP-binding protein, partial [Vicinamibacterales bacterium]